ncbi:hypothetical protein BDZ97DRAFT_1676512, partial [Flammula alnicola]
PHLPQEVPPSPPPRTPLPTPSSSNELSPAWDPSSRTPRAGSPVQVSATGDSPSGMPTSAGHSNHWLRAEALIGIRVKVRDTRDGSDGRILEVIKIEQVYARLREGMTFKNVPLEYVVPVLPDAVRDSVTPFRGENRGRIFKVKTWGLDTCKVRREGVRLRKSEVDPSYPTADLVQVFPPHK